MKHFHLKRLLALVLAAAMVLSLGVNAYAVGDDRVSLSFEELDADAVSAELKNTQNAVEEGSTMYDDDEMVRVTIVLEKDSSLKTQSLSEAATSAYRQALKAEQNALAARISREILDGEQLDVVWNLTLAENAISANVPYGKMAEISRMTGVKAVYLETRYLPMTVANTSNVVAQQMTGASTVQTGAGYTGAGSRIAVIDTGTDTDHQSFDDGAYQYALSLLAAQKGQSTEDYVASLNLLDAEEIERVLTSLNAFARYDGLTVEDLYLSSKLPFAFNYVDGSLDVTHDHDDETEHGSHVAGISTANSYIPTTDKAVYDFDQDGDTDQADAQALLDYVVQGTEIGNADRADLSGNGSVSAYDAELLLNQLEDGQFYISGEKTVGVTGVAPDAQLLTMKVFGQKGGAYSSDYMAAVEDAIALGCDSVNLSLGGAYPGFLTAHEESIADSVYVDNIMAEIENTGIVMCVAAGNAGNWADSDDAYQHMYTDEAGTAMVSDPGVYENTLCVASVDNVGAVREHETLFAGTFEPNVEDTPNALNRLWTALDRGGKGTSYDVVFLGDPSGIMSGAEQADQRVYAATKDDFAGVDFTGKVVLIARGNGVYFSLKHELAQAAGAAAVLLYNNVSGPLNASLEGSTAKIPCGGLSLEDAQAIFALCSKDESGNYTTTMKVTTGLHIDNGEDVEYPVMSDFSSWGTTGGLTIKPEITAPGGNIYSVNGGVSATDQYELMSGTSMATPHVSGLVALAMQYFRETGLVAKAQEVSGMKELSARTLAQSLLMSTAQPLTEESTGLEYAVRNQGAGLANIQNVVDAESFILMEGLADGKVKAELGDGTQDWTFSFTMYNLDNTARVYDLDASILTSDTLVAEDGGKTYNLSADEMTELGAEVTFAGENVTDYQVALPAGGSSKVTVTIHVTDKAAGHMKALGYTNGFYVEGFVYARPQATEEGVLGVTHSIPLMGWYGNWSDPSMFDTGSTLESLYGANQRPSHLAANYKNMLTWQPVGASSGYPYTGNVYSGDAGDQRYLPQRNAVNTTANAAWKLYAIFPTLIRNAADIKLTVTNTETGDVYYEDDFEYMDDTMIACFYYTNAAQWMDTTTEYGAGIEWDGTNPATGKALEEGTPITVALHCAPDYYVNENGTVDWSQVGKGTVLSYDFTVDNTAPALSGGKDALTMSRDGKTLYFTAQDNRYVASVLLLNGSATEAVEYWYPDMDVDQLGAPISGSFDLESYRASHGNKAVIAVCDYAGNETYYGINLGGEGQPYGELLGFQNDFWGGPSIWTAFDEGVAENESPLFASEQTFVCAEYLNGYVLAQDDSGILYAIPYADILSDSVDLASTYVARLENIYQDLAYSYADGILYGLLVEEAGDNLSTSVISINMKGDYFDEDNWMDVKAYQEDWAAGRGGVYGLGLACDDEGSVYMMAVSTDEETGEETNAQLWKASMEEDWGSRYLGAFQLMGDTGLPMNYLQSMTWDHNTETLYWARFCPVTMFTWESTLEKVDPDTGACTRVGTLTNETCCLIAPLTEESAAKEAHANVPAFDSEDIGTPIISQTILTMNVGATASLTYNLDPWWTGHKDVIWSTSDSNVATVDQNGLVTGVKEGICTVTVTAKDDESKFTSCNVSVAALDLEISGIISAQGAGVGSVIGISTYDYTMVDGVPTFGTKKEITYPEEFQGFGTSLSCSTIARGSMWACDYSNAGVVYEIDPETGVVKDMLEPIEGDMLFGMAYSEVTDCFTGIMNYYLFVDEPFTHEASEESAKYYDEEEHQISWHRVDMSEYLAASDKGFATGESDSGSIVDVVLCGVTTIPGGEAQDLATDFLGNYSMNGEAMYTPTITLVLLDNVGRLWYIDEITGMQRYEEYGTSYYGNEEGTAMIPADFYGVFTQDYEDGTSNVFVIREVAETPMTDMYMGGTMPRITYHFSDLTYSQGEDGRDMFFVSMYDYWNNGTTSQLYLYIPGVGTGEFAWDENWNRYEIKTPDALYDLGTTGEGNIIATINTGKVTGGLVSEETTSRPLAIYKGFFQN